MSKVLPAKQFHQSDHGDNLEDVCPRYQKWLKRITKNDKASRKANKSSTSHSAPYMNLFSSRLSKRKRNKNKTTDCHEPVVTKKDHSSLTNKEKPLRSKSIFFRIRQKGRNFGIRCKTSVELWRKWIKRGIHWDRSPPKPVDIDIINKSDNKLKDFTKKSIINEVILEEEEEDGESIVSRLKVTETKNGEQRPAENGDNASGRGKTDKSPERNFLTEISYIHKASNLFRSTKAKDEPISAANGNTRDLQHSNGQAKYPMQDLASMDIGRIEKIESAVERQRNEAQHCTKAQPDSSRPRVPAPHGAINRAFNKLKLFF